MKFTMVSLKTRCQIVRLYTYASLVQVQQVLADLGNSALQPCKQRPGSCSSDCYLSLQLVQQMLARCRTGHCT